MARKKTVNGPASITSSDSEHVSTKPLLSATLVGDPSTSGTNIDILSASANIEREQIKVNNANLSDLKNSCDDVVKRVLSQPSLFIQNHTHTDVKLALGWSSVAIAAGTALYGWKVDFEQSKPVVWTGVILYVLLTTLSTLYAFLIEKDTVYIGKRKLLEKRIETERITVASRTLPSEPSRPPRYKVSVFYVRSSNSGKSLLGKGTESAERGYNEFFDEEGKMDQEKFERWFADIVERVMSNRFQPLSS